MTGELILVTGGTGFIGRHVVKALLENGTSLRVVVRSQAKGDALKSIFPKYTDKIQIAIVENNEAQGAYDSAVEGVDVVVHMASPLPGTAGTDNEAGYLIPARDGIVNMLKSASKSSSVKRVVMTASSAAVIDSKVSTSLPRTWTEKDWNSLTWEDGKKGNLGVAYTVSKKYAEMAAWEFMESQRPHFDLITLDAPGVFGEPVERPASISEIGGSNAILLKTLDPDLKEFPKTWSIFYIDIRDAALAHVKAAFAPKSAGNQRYLIAGPGIGTNKMIREFLIEHYPNRIVAPLSKEAVAENPQQIFDASKAAAAFGIKFRTFEEVIKDFTDFVFSYEN